MAGRVTALCAPKRVLEDPRRPGGLPHYFSSVIMPGRLHCGCMLFGPHPRFLAAGLIAGGEPPPSSREWASASILAVLIFVLDYGLLFWAEQRVPSGIAAVMMATIPVFMALSEIVFLRTQRLTLRLAIALVIGMGGVAALMSRSLHLGGTPIARLD